MKYDVIIDDVTESQWESYASDFADYTIYQTWAYQQVRGEMDKQNISRIIVRNSNGDIVAMCQMRIKCFKPLCLKIGYVQWGPLFRRKDGICKCSEGALKSVVDSCLASMVNVIRFVPNAEADHVGCEFAAMLESVGFEYVKSVRPYFTMMFGVDDSEEQIRSRLHRSWRRGLNKAEQNGFEINERADSQSFQILNSLYLDSKKRKGFEGLDPDEFIKTQNLLPIDIKMNTVIAYHNGEPITVHASSYLGDTAVGTLAASAEKGLECGSSYLVWWRTFLAAKRAGMKRYDLGGIDPKNNFKVYQFKQRMGAQLCQYIGAYEICESSFVKGVWRTAEQVYQLTQRRH